jgi:hypothetical protein
MAINFGDRWSKGCYRNRRRIRVSGQGKITHLLEQKTAPREDPDAQLIRNLARAIKADPSIAGTSRHMSRSDSRL